MEEESHLALIIIKWLKEKYAVNKNGFPYRIPARTKLGKNVLLTLKFLQKEFVKI